MAVITAPTRMLVGQLADLALSAGTDPDVPGTNGVLLHTASGEFTLDVPESDDGEQAMAFSQVSELLIGTSTCGPMLGQAHMPVDGCWHRAAFVTLANVKAIVDTFKPLINSLGKEVTHRTELELAGDTLTVREDPAQVPNGLRLQVAVGDGEGFPVKAIAKLTERDPFEPVMDGAEVVPVEFGHGWTADYMAAMGAVGKRRKMPVAVYRSHQRRAVTVEIGSAYRASVAPCELDDDQSQAPTVPLYTPPAPRRLASAVGE